MSVGVKDSASTKTSASAELLAGILIGCLGSLFFSGKAIIIKLAYREGSDPISLIALRMLYAIPLFLLMWWWVERQSRQQGKTVWQKGDARKIIALGLVGYYLSSFLDFLGLQYISAGLERIVLYLTPSLVLIISLFMYKRKVAAVQWWSMAIAYSGVVAVFVHDLGAQQRNVWLGASLVLASAITYATYLISSGQLVGRLGSLRLTATASLVSSVACVVQALIMSPAKLFAQNPTVHGLSMINGVLCTVLPITLTMMAVERVGSGVASQTGMVGPIATIFLAAYFLGEPVGAMQWLGTALVIFGMFVLSRKK